MILATWPNLETFQTGRLGEVSDIVDLTRTRGEQAATALETKLAGLEKRLDELLASATALETEKSIVPVGDVSEIDAGPMTEAPVQSANHGPTIHSDSQGNGLKEREFGATEEK